jgi:ubiquinone/menaquinone biosynthesis C-methylase UbiE
MSHAHPEGSSIVIHRSGFYDIVAGRFVRRSDGAILARAGVGPGDRVLDVGTGPGYLALAASRLIGPEGAAVGIDASPEMIDRARMRAAREGARAEYQVASAESLPFEEGSFDVAVSRLVLHHLPGELKLRALGEVRRVLRPGGRLLVADMASPAAKGAHHLAAHVLGTHPDPEDALEHLVWEAGFRRITSGKLMRGMLAGVLAVNPERSPQE